jgi:hypothetical protein
MCQSKQLGRLGCYKPPIRSPNLSCPDQPKLPDSGRITGKPEVIRPEYPTCRLHGQVDKFRLGDYMSKWVRFRPGDGSNI